MDWIGWDEKGEKKDRKSCRKKAEDYPKEKQGRLVLIIRFFFSFSFSSLPQFSSLTKRNCNCSLPYASKKIIENSYDMLDLYFDFHQVSVLLVSICKWDYSSTARRTDSIFQSARARKLLLCSNWTGSNNKKYSDKRWGENGFKLTEYEYHDGNKVTL